MVCKMTLLCIRTNCYHVISGIHPVLVHIFRILFHLGAVFHTGVYGSPAKVGGILLEIVYEQE